MHEASHAGCGKAASPAQLGSWRLLREGTGLGEYRELNSEGVSRVDLSASLQAYEWRLGASFSQGGVNPVARGSSSALSSAGVHALATPTANG
jgi:hypothetical protein